MKKRIVALFLALSLIVVPCLAFQSSSFAASSLVSQKNDLQAKLNQYAKDKAAASKSLAEAKSKTNEQAKVVELMYEEINICQNELDTLSSLIEQYFELTKAKEREIEEINERMEKNFSLFSRRLVFAQESGNMSLIDFILGSTDIADILSRSEQVNDMLEYDRKLIESLVSDRQEVEAAKQEIDEALEKCAQQQEEYSARLAELQEKTETANAYLAELKQAQATQQLYYNTVASNQKKAEAELDRIQAEIRAQSATQYTGNYPSPTGWIWPVSNAYKNAISQYFKGSAHSGLDIHTYGVNDKVPALSVAAGKVVRTGYFASWGNLVVVEHANGYQTYYAHLARILVSNGDSVSQGQTVGLIGSTGNSTGPHLHIVVVTPGGQRVDPLQYLPH